MEETPLKKTEKPFKKEEFPKKEVKPVKAIDIVPEVKPAKNLISFDVYFNKKVSEGKFQKHHRAPLLSFVKSQNGSTEMELEEFDKILDSY